MTKPYNNFKTIFFISLGCPKNTVDSEVMAAIALKNNLQIVDNPEKAHVIVVNTCSFIGDAKEESIDALLEMAQHKDISICRFLVAAGCLTQLHGKELKAEIPQIDAVLGSGSFDRLFDLISGKWIDSSIGTSTHFLQKSSTPRLIMNNPSAYIKISDGCSRKCSFCQIPLIKGKTQSRPVKDIVAEAKKMVSAGTVEIILVAQDICSYGKDRQDNASLPVLLKELEKIKNLKWIRLMYLYPDSITDQLILQIAQMTKIAPYLDIPVQHASDSMLKAMKRGYNLKKQIKTIEKLKNKLPGFFLRTTIIVGFPGETSQDIDILLKFMDSISFDHLGVFRYSDEENTHAYSLEPKITSKESYNRWRKVMAWQRKIVKRKHKKLLGRTLPVLVEKYADEQGYVLEGRHIGQAPQIDGITYLVSSKAKPGDIVQAKIIDFKDWDLIAEPVE